MTLALHAPEALAHTNMKLIPSMEQLKCPEKDVDDGQPGTTVSIS